jgi:hypothetical protein
MLAPSAISVFVAAAPAVVEEANNNDRAAAFW